jgi:predicted transcriptional regulator
LESVIAQFESDREFAQAMSESRKGLAQLLYSDEPETLAALRLNAGLSQTQLAQLLETSQSYIARIEAGRVDPGTEMVAKIASALSINEERAFVAIRRQRTRSK